MKIIVTHRFRGVPDGEHHARDYAVGDELEGELADVALLNGWAAREGKIPELPGPKEHQALGGAPEPFRETAGPSLRRRRERA
jgi:hypothetical protein